MCTLNFSTGYVNDDGREVLNWRKVGCKYLEGWFLIVLVSSLPVHSISGSILPSLQPSKVIKFGKITKALNVLRFGKVARLRKDSDIGEKMMNP